MIKEIYSKPVLIFGCGNTLFGDDGFGPAVIDHLCQNYILPDSVSAVDAGTSIRDFLFDILLLPEKPSNIFIVDAVSRSDKKPGEINELDLIQLPGPKLSDFSLHQHPSVNLLNELKELGGVEVRVLAVTAKNIPELVQTGLSREIEAAVPEACEWLLTQINMLNKRADAFRV